jgi:hypothetical protein
MLASAVRNPPVQGKKKTVYPHTPRKLAVFDVVLTALKFAIDCYKEMRNRKIKATRDVFKRGRRKKKT